MLPNILHHVAAMLWILRAIQGSLAGVGKRFTQIETKLDVLLAEQAKQTLALGDIRGHLIPAQATKLSIVQGAVEEQPQL